MGTICAPAYANIFMEKIKKLYIYPYLRDFSTYFCRSIDDIVLLWNGTESELIKFIDNLNIKYPAIKFEFTYSGTSISFLVTKVYKNENGTLCNTIYRKPSDYRNLLHFQSVHPKALKDSIPYSQALRIN